jgi:hypothetical protein
MKQEWQAPVGKASFSHGPQSFFKMIKIYRLSVLGSPCIIAHSYKTTIMKLFSPLLLSKVTFISLILMIFVSYKKIDSVPSPSAPAVITTLLTDITTCSATTGGTIQTNGNATITQSGIVWSKTNATPTLTDNVMAGNIANGSFITNLTGLDFNTVYYIRAFATNNVGTGYGDMVKLNTVNDTSKVRFTYNGKEVVYGIIISFVTGKKWLDRNLGAAQMATAYDDYKAYGDLFQWGRPADGHQLINWTSSTTGTSVNGTTTELATSDIPGHNNFIIPPDAKPFDWQSDNNRNRWATTPQGPCPYGWHVPSMAEWLAEVSNTMGGTANSGGMTNRKTAYSQLKLTVGGNRSLDGPGVVIFATAGRVGHYWTSSVRLNPDGYTDVKDIEMGGDYVQTWDNAKAQSKCIRCLIN